jgi:type IV secretion system protein VirB11
MADMDKAQQERHDRLIEQMRRILGSEICAVFDDPNAVEIMLNDDGKVLVERHGSGITHLTNLPVSKTLNFLSLMADYRGTTVTREKPVVEGAMPDEFLRARFAGAIPPLMPQPTFCIRLPARKVFTLDNYVDKGIINTAQHASIIQAVIEHKNILVSGSTGSGKTTLVNAILHAISERAGLNERLVLIQDTAELQCSAPNTSSMLTYEDSGFDYTKLLKLTLRYRPDRIIVGEVRDGAALALLKAWNTGHPGGLATLHANNPQAALLRLDQLCQEAGVPPQKELIREAVHLVIQIQRDTDHPAGRRITAIEEIREGAEPSPWKRPQTRLAKIRARRL